MHHRTTQLLNIFISVLLFTDIKYVLRVQPELGTHQRNIGASKKCHTYTQKEGLSLSLSLCLFLTVILNADQQNE